MKKKNNLTLLIVLVVAVVGLSIGFAAFSSTLNISFSTTKIVPDEGDFSVVLSSGTTSYLTPYPTYGGKATGGTIDTSDWQSLTDLTATLTAPGDTASWTFYIVNDSSGYDAYLQEINFGNIGVSMDNFITCTAASGTTASSVTSACEAIELTIKVGAQTYKVTDIESYESGYNYIEIDNQKIAWSGGEGDTYLPVVITLTYATGGAVADGDFTINLWDFNFYFETTDQNY